MLRVLRAACACFVCVLCVCVCAPAAARACVENAEQHLRKRETGVGACPLLARGGIPWRGGGGARQQTTTRRRAINMIGAPQRLGSTVLGAEIVI